MGSIENFEPRVREAIEADRPLYTQVRLRWSDFWVTIRPAIARWNADWGRALLGLASPYRLPLVAGKLGDDTATYVLSRAVASALVTGWSLEEEATVDAVTKFLEENYNVLEEILSRGTDPVTFVLGEYDGHAGSVCEEDALPREHG